jgi:Cytochrome P460
MPITTRKCLSLCFLMGIAALTVVCAAARQQQKSEKKVASAAKMPNKTVFADYLKWRRVNPEPVKMDAEVASRCGGPTPEELKRVGGSPHFRRWITVYVNKTGQDAMLHQQTPHFPVGTVIVKEKHEAREDKTVELMTVMTKKPAGYDSIHGDWEYAVTDPNGKVQEQGKLAKCQNCHEQQKSVDYVFKGYVP